MNYDLASVPAPAHLTMRETMPVSTYRQVAEAVERPEIQVVTISQQYGSEGTMLAVKLANTLGWSLSDREIIARVAEHLGIAEEEAALYDEHTFSFADRLLHSLQFITSEAMETWAASQYSMPLSLEWQERLYHAALQKVVQSLACTGRTVMIGHGAQVLLADYANVLHVRVVAPLEHRVQVVMHREQLNTAHALARIQQKDRCLARYLRSQYRRAVDDPLLYDLVINSAALDLDGQLDLICHAIEYKRSWLLPTR